MKIELSPREWIAAVVVLVVLATGEIVSQVIHVRQRRKANALQAELVAATKTIETLEQEMPRFRALAAEQFPSEPSSKRLALLLRRVETIMAANAHMEGRRTPDP